MISNFFLGSEENIFGTFCPFVGQYFLVYEPNPDQNLCHELSNCPGGHEMQIKTRKCNSNLQGD